MYGGTEVDRALCVMTAILYWMRVRNIQPTLPFCPHNKHGTNWRPRLGQETIYVIGYRSIWSWFEINRSNFDEDMR